MNPYLNFPTGDCRAAFDFYQRVFGAKCLFSTTWAESPMADQAPGGDGSKVMHATLQFPDGSLLMGADCPPRCELDGQLRDEGAGVGTGAYAPGRVFALK